MGARDKGSQWCNRLLTEGLLTLRWPVLSFGKAKARRGRGVEPRIVREESQGKGPDACFAAKQIYKAPSPRKLTSYLGRLES